MAGSADGPLAEQGAGEAKEPVRLADWLMRALVEHGIRHVFLVTGGGAMHLDDAAGAEPGLEVVCFLHEQGAAIAAEAYAKVAGIPPLTLVTSGPGGTNAITGLAGAFLDSTPMLVISGQVKRADRVGSTGVRQRGVQELDICSIVAPITKEARVVEEPTEVRQDLERALGLALGGRPGPVWLDVPLDVQGAPVQPDELLGLAPGGVSAPALLADEELDAAARRVYALLERSARPIVLGGAGVRLAGAEEAFRTLVERAGLPVLTTWRSMGLLGEDHHLHVGRPGSLAPRGPNFALQCADVLLALGARLDLVTTGYDPKDFGRRAHKIVVDVDPAELAKLEGAVDEAILADAGAFLEALLRCAPGAGAEHEAGDARSTTRAEWQRRCRAWREHYRVVTPEHARLSDHVSTYHFADVLSDLLSDDDVLVPCSSGLALEILLLTLRLRTGQRAVFTTGLGAMGFAVPAAIGACIGAGGRRTICVDGDGGLQLNIQELETLRRLALPVKLFVIANDGYASIRASQQRWFGRVMGADEPSGVSLPPLEAIAGAYRLPFFRIDPRRELRPQMAEVLDSSGPVVCEVPSPRDEPREPVQVSEALPDGGFRSRAIEDLSPLLPRDELAANLDPDGTFPLVDSPARG